MQDDQALAKEGFAVRILETFHGGLTTVIGADDLQTVGGLEINLVFCPWTEITVLIHNLHIHEGSGLALVVESETQMIGLSCRTDGLTRTDLRIAVLHRSLTGDNLHFARLVFHTPRNMVGRSPIGPA